MLHLISDAPMFVVRPIMTFAVGWAEDAPWDTPAWASTVIHVGDEDAMNVLSALREYRIEGRAPAKQAISDPTFALAAAAIERETSGGSSTPAYVR